LTPACIIAGANGVELLPANQGVRDVTPYTAPEVVQGGEPDVRSDIFSFGAILFELLTGRRVFQGEGPVTLAANIKDAPVPSTGSPVADRLIGGCLVRSSETRTPRMQKILMELKLFSAAARRAEAAARTKPEPALDAAAVRAEIQAVEARFASRLAAQEDRLAAAQRSGMEAIAGIREQVSALGAELAQAQERLAQRSAEMDRESGDRILARVDRGFDAAGEHLSRIEQGLEDVRQRTAQTEEKVSAELDKVQQTLAQHASGIESARAATAQTDDLVERVVEALESLQTAVLDQVESGDRPGFGVN
jgi:hypothetical protein